MCRMQYNNTTAVIIIDKEGGLLTECLACEHKELINDWEESQVNQKVYAMVADR